MLSATGGTYTTVEPDAVKMSPSEVALVTPRPVRMDPKLRLLGTPTARRRSPFLSTPALKDTDGELADTYKISVAHKHRTRVLTAGPNE